MQSKHIIIPEFNHKIFRSSEVLKNYYVVCNGHSVADNCFLVAVNGWHGHLLVGNGCHKEVSSVISFLLIFDNLSLMFEASLLSICQIFMLFWISLFNQIFKFWSSHPCSSTFPLLVINRLSRRRRRISKTITKNFTWGNHKIIKRFKMLEVIIFFGK